jgi:CRP-like cAMP-binding protein
MAGDSASTVYFQDLAGIARSREPSAADWVPVLADIPLFSGLSKRHLRKVASIGRLRRMGKHTQVVREGARGDAFFVIIDGEAVVLAGDRRIRLGPGEYFGELALLDDGPRTATVATESEVLLLEIPRTRFLKLVRDESSISIALLKELAVRLRGASH